MTGKKEGVYFSFLHLGKVEKVFIRKKAYVILMDVEKCMMKWKGPGEVLALNIKGFWMWKWLKGNYCMCKSEVVWMNGLKRIRLASGFCIMTCSLNFYWRDDTWGDSKKR